MVLLRDFNVHSPEWNIHSGEKRDAARLVKLIESYNLILNNEEGKEMWLTQAEITSIIDLAVTTRDIRNIDMWVIDDELTTPSDHEVIVGDFADLKREVGRMWH